MKESAISRIQFSRVCTGCVLLAVCLFGSVGLPEELPVSTPQADSSPYHSEPHVVDELAALESKFDVLMKEVHYFLRNVRFFEAEIYAKEAEQIAVAMVARDPQDPRLQALKRNAHFTTRVARARRIAWMERNGKIDKESSRDCFPFRKAEYHESPEQVLRMQLQDESAALQSEFDHLINSNCKCRERTIRLRAELSP